MTSEFIIALHAAVFLFHVQEWKKSEEISVNVCTNAVCVRKAMSKLVKAGIAEKKEGAKSGGYRIPKSNDVSLSELAAAIGERVVEVKYRSGDMDKTCMIASGMSAFTDDLTAELDKLCRERIEKIKLSDVESDLRRRKADEPFLK